MVQLLDTPVRVTAVFPGAIATHITENSGVAIPGGAASSEGASEMKTLSAEDAAAKIIEGMEDHEYHVLVGRDATMMDKLSRLMPERATKIIQRRMKALLGD